MVEIKAFSGLTYNKEKIDDFSRVITPPHDVISKEMKGELKQKSQYNFVNLILPDKDGDKYNNAAELFKKWQQENVLEQDKEKTIYVYSQNYQANGKNFNRIGFIALIKLEELGKGVLPHENIIETELKSRIELTSAAKADFGIPFLLYDDKERVIDELTKKEIAGKEPYIDFTEEKVNHKIWKISDSDYIQKITDEMKKYQCIIADGHHRYTAELKSMDQLNENKNSEYGLMCFINSFNEGIIILPTNRVVFGLEKVNMNNFLDKLKEYFEIEEVEDINGLVKKIESITIMVDKKGNIKNHVFGVYSNINKKGYFLRLKEGNILDKFFPEKTDIYRKLDVNILHKIIIEEILGITKEQQRNREHIDFVKGHNETIEKMKDKKFQFAFFINPPLMREVFLTARANETMPMKSTYFYPKVFSGLVIYKF